MTAPESHSGGLDANARGILILVAVVAIGALLLWKADSGGTAPARVDTTSETSAVPGTTADLKSNSTSTSTIAPVTSTIAPVTSTSAPDASGQAHQPGEVSVVVLNGGGPVGAAVSTTNQIKTKGYKTGPAGNASVQVASTVVYYADGYLPDATAVAALLGKDAGAAQAKPTTSLGKGADSANVIVILGKDAPPVSGAGDTSTTAAGATTSGTG